MAAATLQQRANFAGDFPRFASAPAVVLLGPASAPLAGRRNWVEDGGVSHCGRCGVEFSMFVRKHHCRSCGNIFCADCSSERVCYDPSGAAQSQGLKRVCKACFAGIKAARRSAGRGRARGLAVLVKEDGRQQALFAEEGERALQAHYEDQAVPDSAPGGAQGGAGWRFDPRCADKEKAELDALFAYYFDKLREQRQEAS